MQQCINERERQTVTNRRVRMGEGAGVEGDRREQRNGTDLKHWPATDK